MKRLRLPLILLFVCVLSQSAHAQNDDWVSVPLDGERLTIRMPKSRDEKKSELNFAPFKLAGRVYTAKSGGVDYSVWSLVDKGEANIAPPFDYAYLDDCAELIWESLLKPRRDKIPEDSKLETHMHYAGALNAGRLPAGREYSISLEDRRGLTRFYIAGRQIYILLALNQEADSVAAKDFFSSFGPKSPALPVATTIKADPMLLPPSERIPTGGGVGAGAGPGTGTGQGGGIGTGRGGNAGGGDRILPATPTATGAGIDYNKIFGGKDVTAKARILTKPEPQYTEGARKFAVTGTVVLRAVFSSSGKVTQIRAVSGLPHGLTERAIVAARNIQFIPAQKDGHQVSMWFQLEYNYNLY
jgi:TonB family protein